MSEIGAEAEYQECADDPYTLMLNTGDVSFNFTFHYYHPS